jgi:hypothetical protein
LPLCCLNSQLVFAFEQFMDTGSDTVEPFFHSPEFRLPPLMGAPGPVDIFGPKHKDSGGYLVLGLAFCKRPQTKSTQSFTEVGFALLRAHSVSLRVLR